ncbi:MAG: glycoside hydrolase family 2 protein, partial [Bacteroidota bacterium]
MKESCRTALTGLFLIFTIALFSQEEDTLDLGGQWQFRQTGTERWIPAHVPGCVHLDLLQNGLIPDPFYRDNEKQLQWIGETGWEYQKTFHCKNDDNSRVNAELVFRGLDTYASVYLNDSLLLEADNMFREWSAGVDKYLHDGLNTIRIIFPSVTAENRIQYARLPYRLPGDEKVVCRKAAYHFGWDWGPAFITSGIWRPIFIRYQKDINVNDVQYIQVNLTHSAAQMAVQFNLDSGIHDSVMVKLYVDSSEILRKSVLVNKGNSRIRMNFMIPNPRRWWPN